MSSSQNIVTPISTFSYMNVWTARPFKEGQLPKFSCAFIFSKTQDVSALLQAYQGVLDEDFGGRLPSAGVPFAWTNPATGLETPFVDGARKYPTDPFYADKIILNTSQSDERAPQVLNQANPPTPIIDKSDVYSGCTGHGLVSFYGYKGGTGGVSASLHAVLKVADGEPLGAAKVDGAAEFANAFGGTAAPGGAAAAPAPTQTGTAAPAAPNAPAAPAPDVPVKAMTPKAMEAGYTYDALVTAGWNDDQMRAEGYLI